MTHRQEQSKPTAPTNGHDRGGGASNNRTHSRHSFVASQSDPVAIERLKLAKWIGRRGGAITGAELRRASRKYNSPEAAEKALDELAKHGFGEWCYPPSGPQGGAPAKRFYLCATTPHYSSACRWSTDDPVATLLTRDGAIDTDNNSLTNQLMNRFGECLVPPPVQVGKISNALYGREKTYFIGCLGTFTVKIGRTSGSVRDRLDIQRHACAYRREILGYAIGNIESELHELLAAYRMEREWFSCHTEVLRTMKTVFLSHVCHVNWGLLWWFSVASLSKWNHLDLPISAESMPNDDYGLQWLAFDRIASLECM